MKKGILKTEKRSLHLEDVLLDKFIEGQAKKGQTPELLNKKIETVLSERNFIFLLFFGAFLFFILFAFVFKTQIINSAFYKQASLNNKYVVYRFSSQRGIVYDRNKTQLVFNESGFDLWDNVSNSLVKQNLTHEEIIFYEAVSDEQFSVVKKMQRVYDATGGLCHLLGYTGRVSVADLEKYPSYRQSDYIGKEGIEKIYEEYLREQKGEMFIEKTAHGKEISRTISKEPVSGKGLVLTLDIALQNKAAQTFLSFKDQGVIKGAIVALDPRNGDILSLLSFPLFDNNLFSSNISKEQWQSLQTNKDKPLLNRATSGLYPTGSAIKPFVAYGALQEGVITENTTLYCPKELCLENKYTKIAECFEDWTFHGYSDVRRALAESINPFFYMIGGGYVAPKQNSPVYDSRLPKTLTGLGALKLAQYLFLFGFGSSANVDLPAEQTGRVPTPEWKANYFKTKEQQAWYLGDTYNLSIGQGYLLATPLQVAVAYAAIANKDGIMYQPHILKEVLTPQGQREKIIEPVVLKENFLNQQNAQIVREGMREVITSPAGSAHLLNTLPVKVAGKTGTAQIYPKTNIYNIWLSVMAPYENPEIILVILLEEGRGVRQYSQQIANEILYWYFTR